MNKRVFYVHIQNHVDRRDDDFYKIRADGLVEARKWAETRKAGNTRSVEGIYTPADFRCRYPWWSKFLRHDKGIIV